MLLAVRVRCGLLRGGVACVVLCVFHVLPLSSPEIEEREDEDPDQVDEVPVQAR